MRERILEHPTVQELHPNRAAGTIQANAFTLYTEAMAEAMYAHLQMEQATGADVEARTVAGKLACSQRMYDLLADPFSQLPLASEAAHASMGAAAGRRRTILDRLLDIADKHTHASGADIWGFYGELVVAVVDYSAQQTVANATIFPGPDTPIDSRGDTLLLNWPERTVFGRALAVNIAANSGSEEASNRTHYADISLHEIIAARIAHAQEVMFESRNLQLQQMADFALVAA